MIEDKVSEEILRSREQRRTKIEFLKSTFKTVITVKSNIPGNDKRHRLAFILADYFLTVIPTDIYCQKWFYDSSDGPYYILGSHLAPKQIKMLAIDIEDNNPLGRFIDIDVFDGEKTLSRNQMRKCYLCDKPAFQCIKEQNHSVEELIDFVKNNVYKHLANETIRLIDQSIVLELNLHPKFGLVTPITSGSHMDMNYDIMISGKDAILPYFKEMFIIGFSSNNLNTIFSEIRKVGLKSEKEMYEATRNINAYKGLIFNMGVTVAAYGYCLYNHIDLSNIFDIIKRMSEDIFEDFNNSDCDSFGYMAYQNYKISGARGEVSKGLISVQKALSKLKDFSQTNRLRTLMYLISISDDTVLLKRAKSLEYYRHVRNLFKSKLDSSNKEIEKLNTYCIRNNLSFGGSADLLIVTIFLKKLLSYTL